MKKAALLAIRLYQLVLSPFVGGQCRFHPTCSNYTREAIDKYGLLKGISLGGKRLLRCHPFHPGGVDHVP
jgi:putative membrane protein insertion efficiency factor